jgi:hypothetical protein
LRSYGTFTWVKMRASTLSASTLSASAS